MLPLFLRNVSKKIGGVAVKIVFEEEMRIVIADGADSRSTVCVESI